MEVLLLGTGSADRWPNPWCACTGCRSARRVGRIRRCTSALVDGHLLIDPGPDVASAGHDLSAVDTVLITHDHPDHLDPAFLLAWAWSPNRRPLTVVGPPQAVDRCRPWVGPDEPVAFHPVATGDIVGSGRLRVRVLPAQHSTTGGRHHDGTAVLYEVVGDARMLYAADTAALPHEELAGQYDLVLLEETFGEVRDHGTAHLDLVGFAHEVARLRSDGRLARDGQVVAVHLSHHNPDDLSERLARIGARVHPDGTLLRVGSDAPGMSPDAPQRGRRLLITGGARSGKSSRAEQLLRGRPAVTYIATAPDYPEDAEWADRIRAHRSRRPGDWNVIETGDPASALRRSEPGESYLVDCLTLWLTRVLDEAGGWDDPQLANAATRHGVGQLCEALAETAADVVLVTNEVGSAVAPHTSSGRLFRDLLGTVNSAVAARCDGVELVTCGVPLVLKGTPWTPST